VYSLFFFFSRMHFNRPSFERQVPTGETFHHLLYTPQYPGAADERGLFSEAGVYILMQPVHIELEEHHRICGCVSTNHTCTQLPTPTSCGVIPTPPPVLQEFSLHPTPLEEPDLEAEAAQAAAAAAASMAQTAAVQAGEMVRSDETPAVNTDGNDPHAGNLARNREFAQFGEASAAFGEQGHEEHQEEDSNPHAQASTHLPEPQGLQTVRLPVDLGMRNAWFPGRMGGVTFAKRKVLEGLVEREERMRGSWDRASSRVDPEREYEYEHGDDSDLEDTRSRSHEYQREHKRQRLHRRHETVFSISGRIPNGDIDGKCASLAGGTTFSSTLNSDSMRSSATPSTSSSPSSSSAQSQAQQSWVYETYDPTRVGAHDLHLHHGPSSSSSFPSSSSSASTTTYNPSCAHCVALDDARRAEKRKEEDKARKVLDRAMRAFGVDSSFVSSSSSSSGAPMDVDVDVDMEMQDFDMSGFGLVGDDDDDVDEDEEDGEEQEEERISVLGDDLPNGQAGFWTTSDRLSSPSPERGSSTRSRSRSNPSTPKRTYIPSTRREFDRARITTSAPCAGIQDIALSGQTPPQHALWCTGGRGYTFYGRVRPWDGLIGIMRVGADGRRVGLGMGVDGNVAGAGAGGEEGEGEEEGEEGALLMDTTFIFGYLVGDTTFVGEWRVAGADPLKPAWSGPIVLSRR
jgi:hypothetical protein